MARLADQPSKAKRGGGPTTPQGKASSSQNSRTHGCTSQKLLLPGESLEAYEELWRTWSDRYCPASEAELSLLRQAVDAAWRLERSNRTLAEVEYALHQEQPSAALWTDAQHKRLQIFRRYQTADSNAFHKAVRLIEFIRKSDQQSRLLNEKIACQALADYRLPEATRDLKSALTKLLARVDLFPKDNDGGHCACPPCHLSWSIAQLQQIIRPSDPKGDPHEPI